MVAAWWWTGRPNFGDLLTAPILKRFCDIEVEHAASISESDVIGVGSTLGLVPEGWAGAVLGTGRMHPERPVYLDAANILALRGPLSAAGVRGDFALGDLGLLAPWLIEPVSKRFKLGVVPHWSDAELFGRIPEWGKYDPVHIGVDAEPLSVVAAIASCEKIVTSSLHGAIVADAFGIPCRIEYAKRFDREGGVFKFRDYHQSIGLPFELGKTRTASRFKVEKVQQGLIDVLARYETIAKANG